jgi:diguanylate cyclase
MNALLLLRSHLGTAVALGLVLLTALALTALRLDFPGEIPGLELLLFGWLGVALGRLAIGFRASERGAAGGPTGTAEKVDHILRSVARLLQTHLSESEAFSERLHGASTRLAQHESSGAVNDIVMALIDDNRQMRDSLSDLRNQLEESRLQVLRLQNNLERSEEAGMRDVVTAIGNRRFFETAFAEELEKARRTGNDFCLALADLDRFKLVNDRFGHLVGDRLLRLFAEILVQNVRGQDRVARFGGEEFAVMLPGARLSEAFEAVERIRRVLESKQWTVEPTGERVGKVTVSFGVAKLRANETGGRSPATGRRASL